MIAWWWAAARADGGSFDQSHAQLAKFLEGAVGSDGRVDYAVLGGRRSLLDAYLAQVRDADPSAWTNAQKLAFYVNAYNAHTIAIVLDAGQPASIRDVDGGKVWDTRTFVVGGRSTTLNQLENGSARPLADGRVHAVLNCTSKGCPPLPAAPLVAATLESQLDAAARRWVATNAWTHAPGSVSLSMIFDWYAGDFARDNHGDIPGVDGKGENALWFVSRFVDEPTRAQILAGDVAVSWTQYDWSLNRK